MRGPRRRWRAVRCAARPRRPAMRFQVPDPALCPAVSHAGGMSYGAPAQGLWGMGLCWGWGPTTGLSSALALPRGGARAPPRVWAACCRRGLIP